MQAAKSPVARLVDDEHEFLLYAGQTIKLGRAAENDIVLVDPKVSRSHAALEWNGTGFTVRDLGSVNGTFVNEQRLVEASRLLRDGDEIRLCKNHFYYEIMRTETVDPPSETVPQPVTADTSPNRWPYLLVSAGPDKGQEYPLWGETITIGRSSRDATWEIRLTDRAISRPHARLELRDDGFYLRDLGSANGSQLNGEPVTDLVLLKDGDMISLGETRIVFHRDKACG